jgi:hypothetical protein
LRFDKLAVPVVSGLKLIAMLPMNCAQKPEPPPTSGQSAPVEQVAPLFVPPKHRWTPAVAAGAGQSLDTPTEFFD